jgi:16S rRNA G966 N2-methylase RsmD
MVQRVLSVEYRPLVSLRFDPQNPRLHDKKQIRQIARSIQTFGFNVPVLIDSQGQIIAGHGRVLAAQFLGMTEVPTIMLEHLTEAQKRTFMIADNRLTENSVWDENLLAQQFKALSVLELDFDVDVSGFEVLEIDTMIEGLAPASRGEADPADSIPDSETNLQITQVGDLWELGRHRVLCGDARHQSTYSAVLGEDRAALVFTDPPYNDPICGYGAEFGKIHLAKLPMASGETNEAKSTRFLTDVLKLLARHSTNGAFQFICRDWRHTSELLTAAAEAYTELENVCVWVNDVAGQSSLYRCQHEFVFVFKSGQQARGNNQLQQFGRHRTNVWKYRPVKSVAQGTDKRHLRDLHPKIKPVELVADAILDCTTGGDIVLDTFLGSGTTLIAAERTGRVCCGVELDPRYVDVIVRRWQKFTGLDAVHQRSGLTFAQQERDITDAQQG